MAKRSCFEGTAASRWGDFGTPTMSSGRLMVEATLKLSRSRTVTEMSPRLDTYARLPAGEMHTSFGVFPTGSTFWSLRIESPSGYTGAAEYTEAVASPEFTTTTSDV